MEVNYGWDEVKLIDRVYYILEQEPVIYSFAPYPTAVQLVELILYYFRNICSTHFVFDAPQSQEAKILEISCQVSKM